MKRLMKMGYADGRRPEMSRFQKIPEVMGSADGRRAESENTGG
jgi:hypothetical protein